VSGLAAARSPLRSIRNCCSATLACPFQTRGKMKLRRSMFLLLLAFLLSSHSPNSGYCFYSTRSQRPLHDPTSPRPLPVASSLNVIASSPSFSPSLSPSTYRLYTRRVWQHNRTIQQLHRQLLQVSETCRILLLL